MNYCGYQTKEQLQEMLRHPLKYGLDKCLSCGGAPIVGAGVFLPSEDLAELSGQPKNKRRAAIYVLCRPCMDDYDRSIARVEQKLLTEAGVQ